ncbi:MAG: undecaprenyl-diphosphatase UppP [Vicinamibacteria bacterium]
MSFLQSLILGIVQGLTEFLPISSTAHLILVPWLLGWKLDPKVAFVFDVLLQLGTVAAVVAYFRKDLASIARATAAGLVERRPLGTPEARLGWLLVLATLPAVVVGLAFKPFFESLHRNPIVVAGILAAGAALIFAAERIGRRSRDLSSVTWRDSLIIGASQSLALLPGVSRSAATICGGMLCDLERPSAARFSFLMSVPILVAASVLAVKDLLELPGFAAHLPPLAAGFLAAAVVGFASIHWLLSYLARRPMNVFAWYRLALGAAGLLFYFSRA